MSVQRPLSLTVRRLAFGASVSLPLALTMTVQAKPSSDLQSRWLEFQSNPRAFMEKTPVKQNAKGVAGPKKAQSLFSDKDIRTGAFVEKKAAVRLGEESLGSSICDANGVCLSDVLQGRAAAHERVQDFLDFNEFQLKNVKPVATLDEMERANLLSAKLDETPWSDTYWPISQGILGARYASSTFVGRGHDWKAYFEYINGNSATLRDVYKGGKQEELNNLSPSEKYDLLIGDLSESNGQVYAAGYLTPRMWSEGEGYWNQAGQVEGWMGICHGWAPAAFMMPRPKSAITVPAADEKTSLKFYPSDLKGLASLLWAKGTGPTKFIGGRCNDKNPEKDPATGRNLSEKCFDTNPGNWHVAIVNQIGVAKRSFVMDATYDYEVWNQPVHSYSYRYFNPQTGQPVSSLKDAVVLASDFSKDKFKKYRSQDAVYVVGIEMDVQYVVETQATHRETDSSVNDAVQTATYMYDLELNSQMQIVGGEWYTNKHPDFLWMPTYDSRATAYGDSILGTSAAGGWEPGQPLPKFWRDIAIATASRYGQPLAAIVEPLLKKAHKGDQQ